MKNRLVILLVLMFTVVGAVTVLVLKEGKYKLSFTLQDGELLNFGELDFSEVTEQLVPEDSPLPGIKSVVVRSLDTQTNSSYDLVSFVNHLATRGNFGYWWMGEGATILPLYSGDKELVGDYYHALFQHKAARTMLFNQALDIVAGLCRNYPPDFRKRVLAKLEDLSAYSRELSAMDLNVEPPEFEDYWKGFLYRRFRYDQVPAGEIQAALATAKGRISTVDVSRQPAGFYQVDINNQIYVIFSHESTSLHAISTSKEVAYPSDVTVTAIKYLSDSSGDYYQVFGVREDVEFKDLYDKNLSLVRF